MLYHYDMKKLEVWDRFLYLSSKLNSKELLDKWFDLFLTLQEKEMLSSRLQIIEALLEGKLTQREIAKKYRVSISQITRGSNALKVIDKKLKKQFFYEKE